MLDRAITSVCDQALRDWELVVVQDGDDAATNRALEAWVAVEPRIRWLHTSRPMTIAEASNFGLEQARGEYVAILDDDDCWSDPDKLNMQIEFLDRRREYVACAGGYCLVDRRGGRLSDFLKPEHDHEIRSGALLANPIANSTAVFRRVIGGKPVFYDEAMSGFADWDFWLTMGTLGKLYNFPCCLAQYMLWDGGGSFYNTMTNARAAMRIVRKHRRYYPRFPLAFTLAFLYVCYACLPLPVRRVSFRTLSTLKKVMASADTGASRVPGLEQTAAPGAAERSEPDGAARPVEIGQETDG